MPNLTFTSEFMLLELSDIRELQILHFFVCLAVYLTTVIVNLLIIIVVALDHHLHTPMYFFLTNLAILDLSSISVLIPKIMVNSLMNSRSISYWGCVAQVFFYLLFESAAFAILTIMAQDRYVAICNPLQYEAIMHKRACMQMAAYAWVTCILYATLHTSCTFVNSFCSNAVDQFFCELPQLLKLSCSDLYVIEIGVIIISCVVAGGCLLYIIITYLHIFATLLRMPSVHVQKKALSTCIPHLTVVSLLVLSAVFAHARPPGDSSELNVICAVIYAILPPLLNPIIYNMRNKAIKTALSKLLTSGYPPRTIIPIKSG